MAIDRAAVIREIANFEVERALELARYAKTWVDREISLLSEDAQDADDEFIDVLSDRAWFLETLVDDAWALATVALHRVVELNSKKIVAWEFGAEHSLAKRYDVRTFYRALGSELGIQGRTLKGFAEVDYIRRVNNSVKHEMKITTDTQHVLGGRVGESLPRLDEFVEKYGPAVPEYLFDLARRVLDSKGDSGQH